MTGTKAGPGEQKRNRGVRPALRFVTAGRRRAVVVMTALAFAGGVAEALFLVTTTRAAFAITDGQESVGIAAGRNLSVDRTLVLALVLVLVRIALAVLANWQSARLVSSVVADVRRDLSQAFLLSSWEAQQGERVGSLQELLTTFTGQASALITAVGLALVSAANLAALTGVAIAVDPLGAVVLVVTVGVLGSGLRPLRRGILRQGAATSATGMDFATTVSEVSNLGLELHVFHVQDAAQRRVSRVIELGRQTQRRLQLMSGLTTPIYVGLAYLALLGALALVAASGSASLTSLGASMLVMLRSLSYGQALQSSYASVSANAPAIDELKRRLAYFRGARRLDGGAALTSLGVVQVRGVSFAYADGHDVLHDVSFSISPGEVIGVVGPSGSGKSTLVQLLLGLRDAQQGTITADGRDIASFDRDLWARKVTFVPQAPRLIAGTIADNIRFLRDDVTDEEVEAAARLAHLHEDIVALGEGYEREVGEQGGRLSGGQQQRLCIARALVERPDLLILDEPTSSLDVRSEHLIRATLLEMKDRMSVVIIAHRLSTLDICDRIMVIQDGRIMGFDTPGALEQSNDFYREALTLSGLR